METHLFLYTDKLGKHENLIVKLQRKHIQIQEKHIREIKWEKPPVAGLFFTWEALVHEWQWYRWKEEVKEVEGVFFEPAYMERVWELLGFWRWFQTLCCMQKGPVFVELSEKNEKLEYLCLHFGAAVCFWEGQYSKVVLQKILRYVTGNRKKFWKETSCENTWEERSKGYVDLTKQRYVHKKSVYELSKKESVLLETLLEQDTQIVAREKLARCVWGKEGEHKQRNLDALIGSLRKKLEPSCLKIHTVYKKGYYIDDK